MKLTEFENKLAQVSPKFTVKTMDLNILNNLVLDNTLPTKLFGKQVVVVMNGKKYATVISSKKPGIVYINDEITNTTVKGLIAQFANTKVNNRNVQFKVASNLIIA